jgi:hypothetical protein
MTYYKIGKWGDREACVQSRSQSDLLLNGPVNEQRLTVAPPVEASAPQAQSIQGAPLSAVTWTQLDEMAMRARVQSKMADEGRMRVAGEELSAGDGADGDWRCPVSEYGGPGDDRQCALPSGHECAHDMVSEPLSASQRMSWGDEVQATIAYWKAATDAGLSDSGATQRANALADQLGDKDARIAELEREIGRLQMAARRGR